MFYWGDQNRNNNMQGQPQQPIQQQPGVETSASNSQAASVPFFNPAQYQNGSMITPDTTNNQVGQTSTEAQWGANYNKNAANQNEAIIQHQGSAMYNQNYHHEGVQQQAYDQQYQQHGVYQDQNYHKSTDDKQAQPQLDNQQQPGYNDQQQAYQVSDPNLTLDPSGQWYWDYNQQQWLPYYNNNTIENVTRGMSELTTGSQNEVQEATEAAAADNYAPYDAGDGGIVTGMSAAEAFNSFSQEESVPTVTSSHQDAPSAANEQQPLYVEPVINQSSAAAAATPPQPSTSNPSSPTNLAANDSNPLIMFSPQQPPQQQALNEDYQHIEGGGPEIAEPEVNHQSPPLGPPDLVDHRPSQQPVDHSRGPPQASGGPDLTHTPQPTPNSHDDHYNWYSNQQASGGMPDVTGGQSHQGKAPDILGAGGVVHPGIPTSDRNLYMETGLLEEDDEVAMVGGRELEPPMVGADSRPPMFSSSSGSLPPMVGAPAVVTGAPASLPPMVGADSLPPTFGASSLPPMVGADSNHSMFNPASSVTSTTTSMPGQEPGFSAPTASAPASAGPTLPPMVGGNEPPPMQQRLVVGSSNDIIIPASLTPTQPREPVEGQQAQDAVPATVPAPVSLGEERSAAAGSEHRNAEMMAMPPIRPAPLPTPGRDITGEESGGAVGGYRRDSRETWDSEEEKDSEREERMRRKRGGGGGNRRNVSPGARSDRHRTARIADRNYRSSTDRDVEDDYGRIRDDRRRRGGSPASKRDISPESRRGGNRRDGSPMSRRGRDGSPASRRGGVRDASPGNRRSGRSHNESYYDRRERERMEEERERERRRGHRGYEDRGGRRMKQEYPDDDDRGSIYDSRISRPASRTGSISHDTSYSRQYGAHNMSSDPYTRMIAEQTAAFQKQQWLFQLQMTNPQAYQPFTPNLSTVTESPQPAEMQRQQLQQAVAEMERALEDPVQGAANVAIYKQYWDQYGSQLEKLRTEQPLMHHLLQHFRSNWWHLVPTKIEKPEERPVSATPSSTDNTAAFGPPAATDSFRANFGPEMSSIVDRERESEEINQELVVGRLTPLMFSRPHACARLSASGFLVKVDAANPLDGQSATVEIHSLSSLLAHTTEHQELSSFPGPLKPGVTHKNDVIKFCEKKIANSRGRSDIADRESYILLWEMLILLLRQKGQVEGSDLAELLLRDVSDPNNDAQNSILGRSRASSNRGDKNEDCSSTSSLVEVELVERTGLDRSLLQASIHAEDSVTRFRNYLLHGNKTEGLEYAMKVGLWGHALFLASKMDQRTYAGVMTRFANGLAINDPLQTLYQLMSSRMPSSMKQCADQRWGDWRPHLAMILSNPLPGSDINRRSMITLGDSLLAKGQLYAAQFCYIVSAAEWGTFSKKSSKLVLLCSQVGDLSLEHFATTEAIQCTEVFEFVQRLGDTQYSMPSLQPYKYLHCIRLVEAGLSTMAQDYVRELAEWVVARVEAGDTDIVDDPVPGWIFQVQYLATKLKYLDPVYTTTAGELAEIPDPEWIGRLDMAVARLQQMGYRTDTTTATMSSILETTEYPEYPGYRWDANLGQYVSIEQEHNGWDGGISAYSEGDQLQVEGHTVAGYSEQQQQQLVAADYEREQFRSGQEDNQDYQSIAEQQQPSNYGELPPTSEPTPSPSHSVSSSTAPPLLFDPSSINSIPGEPPSLSAIPERKTSIVGMGSGHRPSLPRQGSVGRSRQSSINEPQAPPTFFTPGSQPPPIASSALPQPQTTASSSTTQSEEKKESKAEKVTKKPVSGQGKKGSLLGSLMPGLPSWLKPKNQIHLPDDSKPTIIFNEATGRWENTAEGEEDSCAPAAPPPMMPTGPSSLGDGGGGAPPPQMNFRAGLTKRKGPRGYVDVLSKSGITKPVAMAPPSGMNDVSAPPALFNPSAPAPIEGGPTSLNYGGENDTVSAAPAMFNPSSMGGLVTDQPPAF